MQFLTYPECIAWREAHQHHTVTSGEPTRLQYPADSGKKIALARAVMAWALAEGPALIWVTDHGVWPSSEHAPLYERLRQALGDSGTLQSAPGHLVDPGELNDGVSVLALGLMFFWDVFVLPDRPGPIFFGSHDEYVSIFLPAGTGTVPEELHPFV